MLSVAGLIHMKTVFIVLIIIASIVLIASILFQSGNSAGLSGSIGGGAEQLFGKKKSKGYETILSRITTVCAVIFFISAVVLTYLE
jgi:preprotein translocase subunit SecG